MLEELLHPVMQAANANSEVFGERGNRPFARHQAFQAAHQVRVEQQRGGGLVGDRLDPLRFDIFGHVSSLSRDLS